MKKIIDTLTQKIELDIFVLDVLINILNVFDAFCTLRGLTLGRVEELNPIMLFVLKYGDTSFVVSKYFLVFIGTTAITSTSKNTPRSVRIILAILLVFYLSVDIYNLILFNRIG